MQFVLRERLARPAGTEATDGRLQGRGVRALRLQQVPSGDGLSPSRSVDASGSTSRRATIAAGSGFDARNSTSACSSVRTAITSSRPTAGHRRPRRDDPNGDSTCERCGRRFRFAPRRGMTRYPLQLVLRKSTDAGSTALSSSSGWSTTKEVPACSAATGAIRRALTFHHVDPRLKRFNIARIANRSLEVTPRGTRPVHPRMRQLP